MGMVIFFPLLGVLIGLSAARSKGLGTAAGIIGGFLLGPLAVLMFLCSGSKKRCVYCSEWIEKPQWSVTTAAKTSCPNRNRHNRPLLRHPRRPKMLLSAGHRRIITCWPHSRNSKLIQMKKESPALSAGKPFCRSPKNAVFAAVC